MSVFVLPVAWSAAPKLLSQATTLIASLPSGEQIYFVEMTPDISLRQGRLSQQVGSAYTITYLINQDALEKPVLREILTKSILGGYSALNNHKNIPMRHPWLPGLWAKDILEVTALEPQAGTAGQTWGNYNLCKLTVSFESLNYPVNQVRGTSDTYNPNWIEFKYTSGSNRVSIPLGWYYFPDLFPPLPATFGMWKIQPYTNIQMTIYQCTQVQVFGAGVPTSMKPLAATFIGQCNQNSFANCDAETVLLDSVECNPWQDWLGNKLYNVRLNLIYNEWGWNKALTPLGELSRIAYVLGGAKPFPTFLLGTLVGALNP